jgi:lysozyme
MDLERIAKDIKQEEGLRLKPYQCSKGVWTIGYGHTGGVKPEYYPDGIDQQMAEFLFDYDLDQAIRGAESFVGPGPFSELTDARQHCLCDLCLNIGIAGLAQFKRLQAAILAKDWLSAANEIKNSQYWTDVPARAARNRFRMLTGEEPE